MGKRKLYLDTEECREALQGYYTEELDSAEKVAVKILLTRAEWAADLPELRELEKEMGSLYKTHDMLAMRIKKIKRALNIQN